jgi:L-2,4-diaminobutyrate decarboxylase
VQRAAGLLGLGRRAVVPVEVDGEGRMVPGALAGRLDRMPAAGLDPIALVATAGTTDFGAIDPLPELAARAAELVDASPRLALAHRPGLNMVVFRFVPERDEPPRSDRINAAIRVRLLADGAAVVGRTAVHGRTHLKLNLLNPLATGDDLARLVGLVVRTGAELDAHAPTWTGLTRAGGALGLRAGGACRTIGGS